MNAITFYYSPSDVHALTHTLIERADEERFSNLFFSLSLFSYFIYGRIIIAATQAGASEM